MKEIKKICVVGLGYIGLPTAAMFASRGINVVGVDVNAETVETVNRGDIHIIEPDLDEVVHKAVKEKFLRASTATEQADAFIIAVPTPFIGNDHEPDLSYIEAASKAIAPVLMPGNIVILESTSPVGATETMAKWLSNARPELSFPMTNQNSPDIMIAHCPERVLPGEIMRELITNDRVIGGMTAACSARAITLYKTFVTGECVIASSPRVAEMSKLTENSYRDVNIAFANELSRIGDTLDVNVWELISLANRHPRVNILQPGPGVGGHCIAVDPWFIVSSAPEEARLISTARHVNDAKPDYVLDKVNHAVSQHPKATQTIACLGITYKPDIDDLRESPALRITKQLAKTYGANVLVAEPNIDILPEGLNQTGATLCSPEAALEQADIIVGLVGHASFKLLRKPSNDRNVTLLDFCSIWGEDS